MEEELKKEKKRLSEIQCDVKRGKIRKKNKVQFSDTLFEYPAFISIYDCNNSFEYALLDESKNTIIYIYLQLCDGNTLLPSEYVPIEYQGKDMGSKNDWSNTNIYYATDENGDHTYYKDE